MTLDPHLAEDVRRELDAGGVELRHELRADAGGPQAADDLAVDVAGLLEDEDVLHDDDLAFHALYLGDRHDLARSVLEPGDLDDEVHGGGDLLADGALRQGDAAH